MILIREFTLLNLTTQFYLFEVNTALRVCYFSRFNVTCTITVKRRGREEAAQLTVRRVDKEVTS